MNRTTNPTRNSSSATTLGVPLMLAHASLLYWIGRYVERRRPRAFVAVHQCSKVQCRPDQASRLLLRVLGIRAHPT